MTTGTIKSFNPKTGNGTIQADETDDTFPFDTDAVEGYQEGDVLHVGQAVSYEVQGGMAGTMAKAVYLIDARRPADEQ